MTASSSDLSSQADGLRAYVFRLALGLLYFHFGLLKFFPDLSPAEMLASQTVMRLSWGYFDAHSALQTLAIMECALGVILIFNLFGRFTFFVFLFHMAGTFMPLVVLPELTFKVFPLAPNLEGQYILKNIVFVAAGWALLLPSWKTISRKRSRAGSSFLKSFFCIN